MSRSCAPYRVPSWSVLLDKNRKGCLVTSAELHWGRWTQARILGIDCYGVDGALRKSPLGVSMPVPWEQLMSLKRRPFGEARRKPVDIDAGQSTVWNADSAISDGGM